MIIFIAKDEIKSFLYNELAPYQIAPSSEYIQTEYKHRLFNIKVYKSQTITVSGSKEKEIYNKFIEVLDEDNYIGMDEVGVGDFFGPTVYVAVRLTRDDIDKFRNLYVNIKDSKKLKDEEIVHIYNKIKSFIKYEKQIVFDKDIDSSYNSIMQKMYYHYQNYLALKDKSDRKVIIDLFTTENNFHKVAKNMEVEYSNNLKLETKADSKYVSVALASIIARYHFISEMDKLNEKYCFEFPYGANVKLEAIEFIKMYSKAEMAKFCKTTFKTFDEV